MIFGESGGSGRRSGRSSGGSYYNGSFTNYSRYSQSSSGSGRRQEEQRRDISRHARTQHNFDEIILATRVEAQEVIDRMYDLIQQFEQVTVADLYELVGVNGNYTDENWGWTDLRGIGATRLSGGGGYLLDLPKPEQLKN
jgi:hypothetical protein